MLIPRVRVAAGCGAEVAARVEELSRCGPVVLVPPQGGGLALAVEMAEVLFRFPCKVGPLLAKDVDAVTEWLNQGAVQALVVGSIEEIAAVGAQLPKERIVVCVDDPTVYTAEELSVLAASSVSASVSVGAPGASVADALACASKAWSALGKAFPNGISLVCDGALGEGFAERNLAVGKLHHLNGCDSPVHVESDAVVLPSQQAGSSQESGEGFGLGDALVACLRTDRADGLYATVVADELGVALGLVYSSAESILASLACGRGVYWSRSRHSLWRKGDTSGAFQELVSVSFDCDCDALRFCVRQKGEPPSFCHQGFRTCWGADGGLGHLSRTLESRKQSAPAGSYTKRLFDDRALLRNKLLEEAQEVIEAVEEADRKHVAEEVADLAYFLFTACSAGEATLEDVSKVLDLRSRKVKRRPGNAKEFRIKAAEAALQAAASNS